MKRKPTITLTLSMLLGVCCASCQQAPTNAAPSPAAGTASATTAPSGDQVAAAQPPATAAPRRVDVCSLLSAAEVSALMGRTLVQAPHSCEYGLDPTAKEQAMAGAGVKEGAGDAQNMAAMMSSLSKGGVSKVNKMTGTMMDQLTVSVSADQNNETEADIKAVYAKVGGTVNNVLHPEDKNAHDVIQVSNEIPGVGDWAFATNAASVNVMGFSVRGRLFHAGKGRWHVTVGVTVSPDPGTTALDKQLAGVAQALLAKLG
jgi:hypothetical protein